MRVCKMQPIKPTPLHYQTLLLTLWQEPVTEATTQTWRFSLTDPHTMQRTGFRNLDELVQYLQAKIATPT